MTQVAEFEAVECCDCGVRFGMSRRHNSARRADRKTFWCPNGHPQSYTESTADRLRRDLDRAKQNAAHLQDQIKSADAAREAAERRASAARGQVTKFKNRAANGVCPCCNRSFANLRRHMADQHPQFMAEEISGA